MTIRRQLGIKITMKSTNEKKKRRRKLIRKEEGEEEEDCKMFGCSGFGFALNAAAWWAKYVARAFCRYTSDA